MKCSICARGIDEQKDPITGTVYWSEGHNARPVNDGRCCSICNYTVVVPRRLTEMQDKKK